MTAPVISRALVVRLALLMAVIVTLAGHVYVVPSAADAAFVPSAAHPGSAASGSHPTDAGDLAHVALCAAVASTAGVAFDSAAEDRGAVSPGAADGVLHRVRGARALAVPPLRPRSEGSPLFLLHAAFLI